MNRDNARPGIGHADTLGDMFFQQPPDEPDEPPVRVLPEWAGPPRTDRGAVVATELLLARSANVAVALPQILVYRTGCLLTIDVVIRKGDLSGDDWWDLCRSVSDAVRVPSRRWDRVFRVGLRYPDGTTVTNVDQPAHRRRDAAEPPAGPLLMWTPFSGAGGLNQRISQFALWLWPLPPAQPLTLAVEWPLGGIELTTVELDGAGLVAAAERSTGYWSDPG